MSLQMHNAHVAMNRADFMLSLPLPTDRREYWLRVKNIAVTIIAWGN